MSTAIQDQRVQFSIEPLPAVGWVKTAEIVVGFLRMPFSTDEAIISRFKTQIEAELAEFSARLRNPRISRVSWFCEELTFDVYEPPPQSPSPLAPIVWAIIVAALLVLGWVLVILLYIRVKELERVVEEMGKTVEEVMAEKEAALAAGKISEEYAADLNKTLQELKAKADAAGRTDWWNMIERIFEYLPLIIIGFGAIVLIGMLPRRRD